MWQIDNQDKTRKLSRFIDKPDIRVRRQGLEANVWTFSVQSRVTYTPVYWETLGPACLPSFSATLLRHTLGNTGHATVSSR